MAISVANADAYFMSKVLHKEEWTQADEQTRQVALNNAQMNLLRIYKQYNDTDRPLPDEAVFEQALWLLRIDDSIRKAEQGVQTVSVSGISVSVNRVDLSVAPQVRLILGRRVGRSVTS